MSSDADLDLPPYTPERLLAAPFPERVRLVCRTWASQVHPNPMVVMAMYWAKYLLLFAGGWAFFVSFSAGYPGFLSPAAWTFTPVAFQKALLWAISYELAGFGCGMGPMNGRFNPPLGGFYEIETSSPAAEPDTSGASILVHAHRTFHVVGEPDVREPIAKKVLGASLAEIAK